MCELNTLCLNRFTLCQTSCINLVQYFSVSFIVVFLGTENNGIENDDVEQLESDHSALEDEDESRDKTDGDVVSNGECTEAQMRIRTQKTKVANNAVRCRLYENSSFNHFTFVLGKETVGIETNDTEHSSDHGEPEDEDKSRNHCTSASNGKYNWTKAGHVLGTVGFSLGQLTKEPRLFFNYTTAFILLSANNSSSTTTTFLLLAKPVTSELNNQIVDVFVWLADPEK